MLAILHPRRSEYGKLHRSEYEYALSRAFGGYVEDAGVHSGHGQEQSAYYGIEG